MVQRQKDHRVSSAALPRNLVARSGKSGEEDFTPREPPFDFFGETSQRQNLTDGHRMDPDGTGASHRIQNGTRVKTDSLQEAPSVSLPGEKKQGQNRQGCNDKKRNQQIIKPGGHRC
jgi:hypothetical protein